MSVFDQAEVRQRAKQSQLKRTALSRYFQKSQKLRLARSFSAAINGSACLLAFCENMWATRSAAVTYAASNFSPRRVRFFGSTGSWPKIADGLNDPQTQPLLTTLFTHQRAILPYTSGGNYFDEIIDYHDGARLVIQPSHGSHRNGWRHGLAGASLDEA